MHSYIERSRTGYYEALQLITSNESFDITSWVERFLDRLGNAVEGALATLDNVMLINAFWQKHAAHELNPRQAKVLNRLLEGNFEGKLTSTEWAKLTNASEDTSSHDIADLLEKSILKKGDAGGRERWFEADHFDIRFLGGRPPSVGGRPRC